VGRFFKSIRTEGSFARNLTMTVSGNTLAIAVGLLFTPFIARVYTPSAYGMFSLYLSLCQNLIIVSTLQLPRAFVLPEDEQKFEGLLRLTFKCAFITFGISLGLSLMWGTWILEKVGISKDFSGFFIYIIPFAVLVNSLNDIFRSWNIRQKLFNRNAATLVFSSVFARSTALGYGYATSGNINGLIFGDFVSKILDSITLLGKKGLMKTVEIFKRFWLSNDVEILKEYKNYPLFILPGLALQILITQLPIYAAIMFFSPAEAGYYSFAVSLLNIPVNILAGAIAPVFLQKATETFRNDPAQLPALILKMTNRMFYLGVIPIVFLSVFGKEIFVLILGDQWEAAGVFAGYMSLYYLFFLVNYPLNAIYRIHKKERLNLVLNAIGFIMNVCGLLVGILADDYALALLCFAVTSLLQYGIGIVVVFKVAGLDPVRPIVKWLLAAATCYAILWLIRRLIEMTFGSEILL
jgi:O-antigen/teichoic acid export membrane protein